MISTVACASGDQKEQNERGLLGNENTVAAFRPCHRTLPLPKARSLRTHHTYTHPALAPRLFHILLISLLELIHYKTSTMKFLSATLLVSSVGICAAAVSSSNPFAPKVSANTAKAQLNAKLMLRATPLRKLQDNDDEAEEVDLSSYSVKFEKCQFVKQYAYNANGNNKNGQYSDTVLTTKHFVIFRMCPDNSCGTCNYNYGEYIVDMDTYLGYTLEAKKQEQEQYCELCNQCVEAAANGDNGEENADENNNNNANQCANVDTATCYGECQNIDNMEANGYVDASQYAQCQQLNYQDANGNKPYYAGAVCASSGTRIKIGLFTDQYCSTYDESADVATYLKNNDGTALNLSYHLLKQTFAEGECIASCLKQDQNQNNNNNNNQNQRAEVNEVCENLYNYAGKCESTHGFANGMKSYDEYDNQARNEELVCNFITSIKAGTYDLSGDIVVTGGRTTIGGGTTTSGGQKFALTFFILGSVGLAGYAAMLHSQLTKGAKADLSRQGGAMA